MKCLVCIDVNNTSLRSYLTVIVDLIEFSSLVYIATMKVVSPDQREGKNANNNIKIL